MIELTEQQRRQLRDGASGKIWLSDPETKQDYVLMHRNVYEQLVRFLGDDVLASGELVDTIMAEDDANDPYLESYQSITREGQS